MHLLNGELTQLLTPGKIIRYQKAVSKLPQNSITLIAMEIKKIVIHGKKISELESSPVTQV